MTTCGTFQTPLTAALMLEPDGGLVPGTAENITWTIGHSGFDLAQASAGELRRWPATRERVDIDRRDWMPSVIDDDQNDTAASPLRNRTTFVTRRSATQP
jgi:hypothetical protein